MTSQSPLRPEIQWFAKEPPSPLKTAVELLWEFARLHKSNLNPVDSKRCAEEVLDKVMELRAGKDAELERQKDLMS